MMRGGRGRNRGRGRGDMVMDDDHHGDMDNGVNFHSSSPVMFTRSLSTLIVFFFLLFKTMVLFDSLKDGAPWGQTHGAPPSILYLILSN